MFPVASTATRGGSPIEEVTAVAGVPGGTPPAMVVMVYCCAKDRLALRRKSRARFITVSFYLTRVSLPPPFDARALRPVDLTCCARCSAFVGSLPVSRAPQLFDL